MISFDQVLILEQKVENAVAKIAQLNAENAALRKKCAELTNALSAKTEQFSAFQSDQGRIEEGILKALERLNTVENAVLTAAGQESAQVQPAAQQEKIIETQISEPVNQTPAHINQQPEEPQFTQPLSEEPVQQEMQQEQSQPIDAELFANPDFQQNQDFNFNTIEQQDNQDKNTEEDSSIQTQFDIF
ncbi:MAG: cell division protein ZapB [Treponema sp.]|nr:cell division protein ZapB [Treponema sp.]